MPEYGACTVSIASRLHFNLEDVLRTMAAEGHKYIDLFDQDWLHYLSQQPGYDSSNPWSATPAHIAAAKRIGNLIKELGMTCLCLQPLINVEGLLVDSERKWAEATVKSTFPFLRAFQTQIIFLTSQRRHDTGITGDHSAIAADLRLFGEWAQEYSEADGGAPIIIGYEPLSWGSRVNRWADAWDCVVKADHPNVQLVLDTFNMLAVEYADPYNPNGHGRIFDTEKESMAVLRESLHSLASTVDGRRICMVQVADAEKVDSRVFRPPTDPSIPPLLPWSRNHRLYPSEQAIGGYLPVAECLAAIVACGYTGPLTVEVFNTSLASPDKASPSRHARRAIDGLKSVWKDVQEIVPAYRQS